ncbi:MAG: Hsp70 family protein [Methanobacteriota archaeon]|nr:MAG: Hsp70 family protein [Euryarchaeota archaeon]
MIITRPIGIDLGTTNSAAAMLELNEKDILIGRDAQGRTTMPSCVWAEPKTGKIIVGHHAYIRRGSPNPPITSIKRSMGTQLTVTLGQNQYTPAEISAFILRELKHQIETELTSRSSQEQKFDVSKAIITVPAYFNLPAIEATRQAGEMAGLQVMELLHEPTAAAIYYGWKYDLGDGVFMVYDLGGGTFDVSILQRISGEFQVLGISGDNFLGGDDFDRRLAEYIRQVLVADGYKLDLNVRENPEDHLRFNQLMALAEKAKKELSNKDEFILRDQGTLRDQDNSPVVIELAISREQFENLIGDLLDRTIEFCRTALETAKEQGDITLDSIDYILMVGGSSYVPAVMDKVRKTFCEPRNTNEPNKRSPIQLVRDEPENAVALGAALRAAAAGVGISDAQKRVCVWFRNAATTSKHRTLISGRVETLDPAVNLEDGIIRMLSSTGEVLEECKLPSKQNFVFRDVDLVNEFSNEFHFVVIDKQGNQIANISRSIVHEMDQKSTVGRTMSTSVLSKPIVLEGTDGERLIRQVLLPKGTSLPTRKRFTFAVSDSSGKIRLPIYQDNRIIKEIYADVGNINVGTPVQFEIECDELINIKIHASVGEKSVGGKISPPPPDTVPTEYEIQKLIEEFWGALEKLDNRDRVSFEAEFETILRDIKEALAGADYPKVIQRVNDFKALIKNVHIAEPLRPSLETLEEKYQSCLRLFDQVEQAQPELAPKTFREDIQRIFEKGKQAYHDRDRDIYQEVVHTVTTTLQYLVNATKVKVRDSEERDETIHAYMLVEEARQIVQFLLVTSLLNQSIEHLQDIKEYLEEIDALEKLVEQKPIEVIQRCQVIITDVRRKYRQIVPDERRAKQLQGLLKLDFSSGRKNVTTDDDFFKI